MIEFEEVVAVPDPLPLIVLIIQVTRPAELVNRSIKTNGCPATENSHHFAIDNVNYSCTVDIGRRLALAGSYGNTAAKTTDDNAVQLGRISFLIDVDGHMGVLENIRLRNRFAGGNAQTSSREPAHIGLSGNVENGRINRHKVRTG